MARQLSVIQIDSVNVLTRAHYLPAFSRLGGYDRGALDGLSSGRGERRSLFEYWAHEASLLPVEVQPLLRWRMRRARERFETWGRLARLARARPGYIAAVLAEVADRGPMSAGELSDPGQRPTGEWGWNWADGKTALEWLFWTGALTTAGRRGFSRVYDLPERVLPRRVLAAPTPPEDAAQRELVLLAARALGVASAADLADYFRLPPAQGAERVRELRAARLLQEVAVEGWRAPGYLLPGVRVPRRVPATALLVGFDPLIWSRPRVRRLFGFDYRIEIYTPAVKRTHGYYVLPFLHDGALQARVDLKSDRAAGLLLVQAAWAEPGVAADVPAALAGELRMLAGWLGLDAVHVVGPGDVAGPLRAELTTNGAALVAGTSRPEAPASIARHESAS